MEEKQKRFQVVIAHPIPEERRHLTELLEGSGVFRVSLATHDGLDCLRAVADLQPDLVLVNGVLCQIDGLELLRRISELPAPWTRRLYLTTYKNYLAEHAILFGADYCLLTPCPDAVLLQRAIDLVQPRRTTPSDGEIDARAAHILHAIGVSENKKGYYYAVDGVRILVRDPELVMRRQVTTELYGSIAKLHGLDRPERVERCLRTLTVRLFAKNPLSTLAEYFNPADIQRAHITNTAFLTAIAQRVSDTLRAERQVLPTGGMITG